ncbi:site-specific integrase [Lacrimispora sp. NSJ-141]|uniref:Site-specific integrase n=1 Tax=Lientehia hominis TaxID=2897778 RepID=A0AAP2RJ98_9FIRM|nr:site-specific integrase [Lientehia hominis]MCD2492771.1 site-specific integrase [Lientehia hominis]
MGQLRTRKRGATWEYSFEGAKIGGKRKPISKGGYRTKADALTAGTKAKAEYETSGRTFTPSTISLADYLDYWLENHVKKNLGHNTYLDYESKTRNHIKPALGKYRLSAIEPDIVQNWIDNVKLKGFSVSMVRNLLACLSGALEYAVIPMKFIKYNPCSYVKLGRLKESPELKIKREYICSADDWEKIMSRFPEGSSFYLPLLTSYHLGTRIGETYGLDLLTDFDFGARTCSINQQVQKEDRVWYQRPPKYESYRTVDMGSTIQKAIRKEYIKRKETMLFYGPYYLKTYVRPDGSIVQFPASETVPYREIMPLSVKENGQLLTPESFKYCARVIHNELGLVLFHSHSLRHTHGTLLAENGASPKTVMERLGHKDISTTMNRYVFNTEKMRSDAVRIFEEVTG